MWESEDELARGFEESQLKLLCSGKRDGVPFGEAGIAVLFRYTWSGFQHPLQTQIGEAIGGDVFADFFGGVTGGDQLFFSRRIDTVKARRDNRRGTDPHMHFLGAGMPQHLHNFSTGRPPHQ